MSEDTIPQTDLSMGEGDGQEQPDLKAAPTVNSSETALDPDLKAAPTGSETALDPDLKAAPTIAGDTLEPDLKAAPT
jgi:hypothetical protein